MSTKFDKQTTIDMLRMSLALTVAVHEGFSKGSAKQEFASDAIDALTAALEVLKHE